FEIYEDQMEALRRLSYQEKMEGQVGSMSAMVRAAIDCLRRRTSRTWRIGTLFAGMALPASFDTRSNPTGSCSAPADHPTRFSRVWCPPSSESLPSSDRTHCPPSIGLAAHLGPDCA